MVQESFHVTDPDMLRAFAHPLRQRILWELSVRTHVRAADIAALLGEPANSVSFHLRALAKVGLIVEAPEFARDQRDRAWKLAHETGYSFDPQSPGGDVFTAAQLAWVRGMLDDSLPRDEKAARGQYSGAALLTRAEAKVLFEELADILERYRLMGAKAADEHPDDPNRVFHNLMLLMGNREPTGEAAADPTKVTEPTKATGSAAEPSPGRNG